MWRKNNFQEKPTDCAARKFTSRDRLMAQDGYAVFVERGAIRVHDGPFSFHETPEMIHGDIIYCL